MKTIGVFFGSRSTEHDISIITAELIISGLRGLEYDVVPVYIGKDGGWYIDERFGELKTFINPAFNIEKEAKYQQYYLDLEESKGVLVFRKKGLNGKKVVVDLAFPAFHGSYGEDGTIQGLFEMFNVLYVGCNVAASAVSMDKALTKQVCQANEIPITKYEYFYKVDWEKNQKMFLDKIMKDLKFPVFVKPVHLGSSIGIAKVKNFDELAEKIEVAFYYDNKVLVEEGVTDLMDVTCCLIGNEEIIPSLLQESVFQADLFDFEEKYLNDGGGQFGKATSSLVIPARLDEKTTKTIQETAINVYKALDCTGIARVDFLYNKKTKEFFANEVNPLPGTLYHHLWKESGVDLPELLKRLLDYAEEIHKNKAKQTITFNSSVLTNLNSAKMGKKLKDK